MGAGSSKTLEATSSEGGKRTPSIWVFAFLYFACYVPFTALTKALSGGDYPGSGDGIGGIVLLPISSLAGLVVMAVFLGATGWWRFASKFEVLGVSIPVPTRWTALSGLCTSVILTTTTLAYTFEGVSLVFVMLLMRGGVLVIAPIIDQLVGQHVRWFSWVGLSLSALALVVAFAERGGYDITLLCAVDIALYLIAYFIRLRFIARLGKSDDPAVTKRYFAEEQLMTTPFTVLMLVVFGVLGLGEFGSQLREGLTTHWQSGFVLETALIGVFSQCVGIFGTLVFLDRSESSFSVPVNRCSSVMAGVVTSGVLAIILGAAMPSAYQLGGAAIVVAAIFVLGLGSAYTSRKEALERSA